MQERPASDKARFIAYYFPQFYPIEENDAWWGKGFTDWRFVASARPLFSGHYQPRIPKDLGFYDLRLAETRKAQADLAKNYGIEGFLYWHYWFHGRRMLNRVFDEVLESGSPDFPFCLGWANENWEGRWFGLSHGRRLVTQLYSEEDSVRHFYSVLRAFRDPRYITIDGKPLFHVKNCYYNPLLDLAHLSLWRQLAAKEGLPGIHFTTELYASREWQSPWCQTRLAAFDGWTFVNLNNHPASALLRGTPTTYRYADVAPRFFADTADARYFPTILPGWDNTPRWPKNSVFHNATPEIFSEVVRRAIEVVGARPREQRLIFLKSWNEWGEGNHLEPDLRFGNGFLKAIVDSL
jgi:lipopolysaccharide biosynthesis protein